VPDVSETAFEDESPKDLALRLSIAKAQNITKKYPSGLIIGSDQTLDCEGVILGKPRNEEKAIMQLTKMSGKTLTFYTGLCVINAETMSSEQDVIKYEVVFRKLTEAEIERYVSHEKPIDCAGSFKSEQLGISLCESMQGDDPSALIGLPLIKLAQSLREFGLQVP